MNTKVRLQISRVLNERFEFTVDGVEEKAEKLRLLWGEKEEIILNGLEKITGLSFLHNYIDVFLINPDGKPSISFPIILKVFDNPHKTVCVLVHELIHNLMWDNTENNNWSIKIQELYPTESKKVAIHICVHAILEAMYIDILKKPEDITEDIEDSQKSPDYKRAWEIVTEEGYKNIIDKLRSY